MGTIQESVPIRGLNRGRPGISDLILWVLASGLAAWIFRGSSLRSGVGLELDLERVVGVVLATLAVVLTVPIVRGISRRLRDRGDLGRRARAWAIGWRAFAAAALLAGISEERAVLGPVSLGTFGSGSEQTYHLFNEPARRGFYPVALAMLLVGVALGLSGGRPWPDRRRGNRSAFVVLAALAGLLLATHPGVQFIPYLVLQALQGISDTYPPASPIAPGRPGLAARLREAGLTGAIGGLILLVVALGLSGDFHRGRIGGSISARWFLTRFLGVLCAAAVGVTLILVEIPRLEPALAWGVGTLLGPKEVAAMVVGFGAFAAGLAARSLARPGESPGSRSRMLKVLIAAAWASTLGLIGLAAVHLGAGWAAWNDPSLRGDAPELSAGWLARSIAAVVRFDTRLFAEVPGFGLLSAVFFPDRLLWSLAVLWIVASLVVPAIRGRAGNPAPFDELADPAENVARFVWLTVGLTTVCLAAMPAFLLMGLFLFHVRHQAAEVLGWPI